MLKTRTKIKPVFDIEHKNEKFFFLYLEALEGFWPLMLKFLFAADSENSALAPFKANFIIPKVYRELQTTSKLLTKKIKNFSFSFRGLSSFCMTNDTASFSLRGCANTKKLFILAHRRDKRLVEEVKNEQR